MNRLKNRNLLLVKNHIIKTEAVIVICGFRLNRSYNTVEKVRNLWYNKVSKKIGAVEQNMDIPIELISDEKGYFDRECPNDNCLYTFKIKMQDWKDKVSDEEVHCPM